MASWIPPTQVPSNLQALDFELLYLKLVDMFPNADTAFLWEECKLRAGNEEAMNVFIAELVENNSTSDKFVEQEYQKLLALFPDADPGYLWTQCQLKSLDQNALKTFIDHCLQHRDYPKVCKSADEVDRLKVDVQYQKLLELFPDADPKYLWEQCLARVNDERKMEDFIQFSKCYLNYPKNPDKPAPNVELEGVEDGLQEVVSYQYHYMLEMLPKADPNYLLEKCKSFAGNEDALQNFLSEALEDESFPTVENHLEVQKAILLHKKYFENFYAEDFMNIFPDPWRYFLEEKPGSKDPCPLALEYLRKRYGDVDNKIVEATYKRLKNSLARTCKELDAGRPGVPEMKWDSLYNIKNLNVPFVQEVAFIENEAKLKDYLEFRKMVRQKAFTRAKAAGTLLECACCYNSELLPEDVTTCSSGHLFCVECVTRGAEAWIGEGKTRFPCYVECKGEFSLITLKCVLKPAVYSNLLLRKQLTEITEAGISEIETCPFCDYVTIPPEEDKVFHCLNPLCMKDSCRSCKEPSHIPFRCNEVEKPEEIRMRIYIEDKMTAALVRQCYKCKRKFVKQDGCNKMTCTCGALMCYLCRQPVQNYSHFDTGRCPLYSNNEDLHVNAVVREGKKAREEVLTSNPGFKLKNDPTELPPM